MEKTPKQLAEETAIPVKDVLADPTHPAHETVLKILEGLKNGTIHLS